MSRISLKNPETGDVHNMDAEAFAELRQAVEQAEEAERDEVVFRAMRLDLDQAKGVLENESSAT